MHCHNNFMADYLEELVQKITTRADLKGFDDLDRKQRRAIKTNDILGQSFRRAFGIFFGIQGVRSIIQTSREFDLLQRSISGLTGSTQDWEYLRKEAYRTGTDLTKAAGAYKNFYSAANMAGFDKGAIQGMFSDVLTAGRGIGANQQQIGAALLALEQMLSKGKVSMEELRRQMGNALPGAFEIAAKSMGVTTQEFNKMLEAGLDANKFVPRFTAMLRQELGKGFEANIKSLDFALVNLNNAWKEFQANILQGEAGEALAQLVNDITKILKSQELLNFIKLIGRGLAFVIKHAREIAILWGFSRFIRLIKYIREVDKAITATRISTGLLDYQTKALMFSYRWLAQGKVALAFGAIRKGIMGAVGASALLAAQWVGILGVILMVQDVVTWLFDRDKTTHTFTGYLLNKTKNEGVSKNINNNPMLSLTTEEKKEAERNLGRIGKHLNARKNKNGSWDYYLEDNLYSAPGRPEPKIIGRQIYTPNTHIGNTNNLSSAYQNSLAQSQNNNVTININAPNSQPEIIAQSVEDALADFFKTYKESYA